MCVCVCVCVCVYLCMLFKHKSTMLNSFKFINNSWNISFVLIYDISIILGYLLANGNIYAPLPVFEDSEKRMNGFYSRNTKLT